MSVIWRVRRRTWVRPERTPPAPPAAYGRGSGTMRRRCRPARTRSSRSGMRCWRRPDAADVEEPRIGPWAGWHTLSVDDAWVRPYTPGRGRWLVIAWEAAALGLLAWTTIQQFD